MQPIPSTMPDVPGSAAPAGAALRRILVLIPLPYSPDGTFWTREAGLLVLALRRLGYEAHLVLLGDPAQRVDPQLPLILATRSNLEDAVWWKQQSVDGVVFFMWAATRYERIRDAARAATGRVLEKLDSDGVRSPRVWFSLYVFQFWSSLRDRRDSFWQRSLAPLIAAVRGVSLWLWPGLLDERLARGLSRLPVVGVESPIAVERIKRFLRIMRQPVPQVICIPHPVDDLQMGFNPAVAKENKIISVGRWNDHQKNFPRLLAVLTQFLALHPDWSADIVGKLPADLDRRKQRIPEPVLRRMRFFGVVPFSELPRLYQSARIFLLTSRHEGLCNAGSEALCCGCSVVAPVDTAGTVFMVARSSGTPACRQGTVHILDALCAEAQEWAQGRRDPEKISHEWLALGGASAVARNVVQALESIPLPTRPGA